MTATDKATARPWMRDGRTIYALQEIKWMGKPAQANRFQAAVQGNGPIGADEAELEANAELIVRAVNRDHLFEKMVEALESTLALLEWCEDKAVYAPYVAILDEVKSCK